MKKTLIFCFMTAITYTLTAQHNAITLEDIWQKGTFSAAYTQIGRSMADGTHYTMMNNDEVAQYSYATGEKTAVLCNLADIKDALGAAPESYQLDDAEKQILFSTGFHPIYRHSGVSDYYLYDISTKEIKKLSSAGKQRLTTFSPDGKKVGFVRDNNLFVLDLVTMQETAITTDGKFNHIINGTTDWVYEEEFSITRGFHFSPDSRRIAYYRFDESNVKEYSMQMWGDLYPDNYTYKYPKAGEDNSVVEILIYDLEQHKKIAPELGSKNDQYLPRFYWTKNATQLMAMRMNRLQNKMELILIDATSGDTRIVYTEECDTYVDVPETLHFLSDGDHYLLTSERDGFNQIYLCSLKGGEPQKVTKGAYDVVSVCGIDEKRQTIYYTAHYSSAINTELMSVDWKGKKEQLLSKEEGSYSVAFSKGCNYYIQYYSTANKAPVVTLHDRKGKVIRTLQDNAALQAQMEQYGATRKEFKTFTTSNGTELNYYIIMPENFDPNKRYPLLIHVYGGPGIQRVTNSYSGGDHYWFHMLTQQGYAVVCFDGRGTGGRGAEFKKCTYRNLGKLECEDAIEAARYFGQQTWCDASRIGIFGWSFGGYLSTLAILKGNDVYKTAIAVAPVITWRYYDNIYTERFLQLPEQNQEGYDDNSPLNFADRLQGNYLIVHGTADDNVHVQNALDMISALEKAGKQFEMRFYPNKNHGIYGGNARLNLYELMTDFLKRKL